MAAVIRANRFLIPITVVGIFVVAVLTQAQDSSRKASPVSSATSPLRAHDGDLREVSTARENMALVPWETALHW